MKGTATVVSSAGGVMLGIFIIAQLAFKGAAEDPVPKYFSPKIPEQISFAGEAVPLNRWDVRERFDRELLFNYHNEANVLFLLKLANRYFSTISERLKANEVPDDFKYLCVAESNLLSGALSRAGAVGFWQFMDGTAPGFGLETGSQVDYRYDAEKSTDAACKYLKQAYAKFGSWTAAAASYNCGQGGYNGQATFQGTTNYYDLLLPEETNRYLFRILTFKHLMENAEKLGFDVKENEKYDVIPYRTDTVASTILNLAQYAKQKGTTFKMVRQMNPWLRGRSLTVRSGKKYIIKLPKE